ncbi:hypothetical protein [Bifidobacterium callitrichidarum]|uniref:O-antigen ligase domain-containing protein n=1 Tax=Bifidobacterium callitrichidarum TaxID=2052941 RepID=A0A2U2N5J1_9BIFI|nr:hypothetical protein [Bifidobacterium callitrichidarum]PWG64446.1 hypothetical protein DF196_08660 [Bifidobacterium callitrichidarum]
MMTDPLLPPRLFTPRDRTDYLFALALPTLPVDGTVIGFYQPFWTPISPWLLVVYCLLNPKLLRQSARTYTPLMALPIALIALSIPGWMAFGFHANAVLMSLSGVIAVPMSIVALDIAFCRKHLSWQESIRIIIAAYWFAFAVGVAQWLAIRAGLANAQGYFSQLMARSYVETGAHWAGDHARPQFLFAEPSYIGMHLFGVLLPLFWLIRPRDSVYAKRLKHLIMAFAAGSVAIGAGVRIVLDSLVALIVVIIVELRWSDAAQRRKGTLLLGVMAAAGAVCCVVVPRLRSIMTHGITGDGSFFGRIYQSLGPLGGILEHPWTALTGFGAGNIADAMHAGSTNAARMLTLLGTDPHTATNWYASITPDTAWTMSAYTSFITEFGMIGFIAFLAVTLRFVTCGSGSQSGTTTPVSVRYSHNTIANDQSNNSRITTAPGTPRPWTKLTICWLVLLAYLYLQFEGYTFVAIPLFVWSMTNCEHCYSTVIPKSELKGSTAADISQ